jgi:hypothetical protein
MGECQKKGKKKETTTTGGGNFEANKFWGQILRRKNLVGFLKNGPEKFGGNF